MFVSTVPQAGATSRRGVARNRRIGSIALIEALEDRRLLAAQTIQTWANLRSEGSSPSLSVSANVPQEITHATISWSGGVSEGSGVTSPSSTAPPPYQGQTTYTARVNGIEAERMTSNWFQAWTPYNVQHFTIDHEYFRNGVRQNTAQGVGNGSVKVQGGGSVSATFNGQNFADAPFSKGRIHLRSVSVVAHTANLTTTGTSVAVESKRQLKVTVRDDNGKPVAGAAVRLDKQTPADPNRPGTVSLSGSGTTGADGVATFEVTGQKSGVVDLKFTSNKGGTTTARVTVEPLIVAKRWPVAGAKVAQKAWDLIRPTIPVDLLGKRAGDVAGLLPLIDGDDVEERVETIIRRSIDRVVDRMLSQGPHLNDWTVRNGHDPEHFANDAAPATHLIFDRLELLGVGVAFDLTLENPQLSPDKTRKGFFFRAHIDVDLNPQIFGNKLPIGASANLTFGMEEIHASGGYEQGRLND